MGSISETPLADLQAIWKRFWWIVNWKWRT
jgi:hypothetical protein